VLKKIIVFAVYLSFMSMFIACGKGDNPSVPLPEFPVIDGSSSTVLMHAAIRAYLTDAHFINSHSQTYAALERIIPGSGNPADIILAVKYYDETLQDAKERGADLIITPIAKEGFVFILHKDNPVDSLTKQQLRDIYSGKITNWKEVGGRDERIIPYIRNWDSGSQTAMEEFMDGEQIIGREDRVISGMMFLLTQVQETGSAGIGYNILSWSMGQNLDAMGLKAVAVDGIKPENKTLSDSSYPLMVYTYSYYNSGNEKGKNLTDWLLTPEGQRVIASADYVGIFGELPSGEMPDLYKDEFKAQNKVEEYYMDNGFDYEKGHFYTERIEDEAETEIFAKGSGKDVTVMFLVHFMEYEPEWEFTRFIVLTRERGGEFVIINEGDYLPANH